MSQDANNAVIDEGLPYQKMGKGCYLSQNTSAQKMAQMLGMKPDMQNEMAIYMDKNQTTVCQRRGKQALHQTGWRED